MDYFINDTAALTDETEVRQSVGEAARAIWDSADAVDRGELYSVLYEAVTETISFDEAVARIVVMIPALAGWAPTEAVRKRVFLALMYVVLMWGNPQSEPPTPPPPPTEINVTVNVNVQVETGGQSEDQVRQTVEEAIRRAQEKPSSSEQPSG